MLQLLELESNISTCIWLDSHFERVENEFSIFGHGIRANHQCLRAQVLSLLKYNFCYARVLICVFSALLVSNLQVYLEFLACRNRNFLGILVDFRSY